MYIKPTSGQVDKWTSGQVHRSVFGSLRHLVGFVVVVENLAVQVSLDVICLHLEAFGTFIR